MTNENPLPGEPRTETVVVIGNGMVGHRLCERLAVGDEPCSHRMVVFGEEPRPAYDRIRLTELLAGRAANELELHGREWYQQQGIELVLSDPVVAVDRARRCVRSQSGREQEYDWLVFATGAAPVVPEIEGHDLPGVFVYRTVSDLEAIAGWSRGARRAAVLGGGLLGLEAARALRNLGLEVTVLEAGAHLMPSQLDAEAGTLLERLVSGVGVAVRSGVRVERIVRTPAGLELVLGAEVGSLVVDLVVVSAGIRPRDKLAAYAGLDCGPRGGICIDQQMCTSDPRIFAIGDCALFQGLVSGLLAPGYRMAEVLARRLKGGWPRFEGVDRTTRLKLLEIDVAVVGQYHAPGRAIVHRTTEGYRKLILAGGRLVGAMGVGPWPGLTELQRRLETASRIWPWQRRRFARTGEIADAANRPLRALPQTAVVCHCLGVTRGALERAMLGGCRTVAALATATGASTACGGCRPEIGSLLGQAVAAPPVGGRRLLVGSSAAALLALGAWLLSDPVAASGTLQHGWWLQQLWRSGTARQVTGFSLLALVTGAMLLSGRKRTRWLGKGSFGRWRAVHAGIGALSVLAVAVHTGLRGGENLNRALLVAFLIMNGAGAATGAVAAGTGPEAAGSWQRAIRTGHVALFWVVLPLLLFHVVAVYWF